MHMPLPLSEYVTRARPFAQLQLPQEQGVNSVPIATVLLANCAEARGDPTGADLRQVVDLLVVVARRQVPMVLAVQRVVVVMDLFMLKTFSGSAVAVHRQIRRHPCCVP